MYPAIPGAYDPFSITDILLYTSLRFFFIVSQLPLNSTDPRITDHIQVLILYKNNSFK